MSAQILLLVWSATLFAGYILVQSTLYRVDYGIGFALTARDVERAPGKYTARSAKALNNLLETYAVFVALSVAAELGHHSNGLTIWGAQLYFWCRWVYLPLYVFGVPYVRSVVWIASAIGLILMFVGLVS